MTLKRYRGPLKGVILDWAGTIIDYGCFGPVMAFIEIFKKRGIELSAQEVRQSMGLHKREHIKEILSLPSVKEKWLSTFKREAKAQDIDELFKEFVPTQLQSLVDHAGLILGVKETIEYFREIGFKIGTTTGYTRVMMDLILPLAKRQGFVPDALVCADEVPKARPSPFMCFQNAIKLEVYPMASLIKIGDTVVDIEEGLNAGTWTIGIAKTGNLVGLSQESFENLALKEQNQRLEKAHLSLKDAGAHYVVDTLSDVKALLADIEKRLLAGEKP